MAQSKEIKVFLKEIDEVCRKYDLSIEHEDSHGSFIITPYNTIAKEWLSEAENGVKRRRAK